MICLEGKNPAKQKSAAEKRRENRSSGVHFEAFTQSCVWDLTFTPFISSNCALKFAANRNFDGICSKEGRYITWEMLDDLEGCFSRNGKKFKSTVCQGMDLGINKPNLCCKLGEHQ